MSNSISQLFRINLNEEHPASRLTHFGLVIMGVSLMNFIASLAMATILAGGTIAGGDIVTRMNYIVAHKTWVQLGWASWIGATLSLTLFFMLMPALLDRKYKQYLNFALVLTVVGAASDTLSDLMSLGIIPDLAERYLAAAEPMLRATLKEQFITWDRFSILCTGGLGNTCYGFAGCLLSYTLVKSGEFNALVRYVSAPLWGLTFLMSYGSFALSAGILPFAVGSTMSLFIAWSFYIGLCLYLKGRS